MIKEAIIKLVNKGDLTCNEAKEVMLEIMGGKTTPTRMRLSWQPFPPRAPRRKPSTKFPAVRKPCGPWPRPCPIRGWK